MFEEYTEEYFQNIAEEMGETLGVDTRQGSIYMDAAMGHIIRTAKFYEDLSTIMEMLNIDTCVGEILDAKCSEFAITRKQATHAYYNFSTDFTGDMEELLGKRFYCNNTYFVVSCIGEKYYMMAEESGAGFNSIPSQKLDDVDYTDGLDEAMLLDLAVEGTDEESDEALRNRLRNKIIDQPGGGNKAQYKHWCESFKGVGKAVIVPLGRGDNTVEAVIISENGTKPAESLIGEIQNYIDPGSEGLGEGVADIGCKFYAKACTELQINVSCNAVLANGYTKDTALALIKQSLKDYLKLVSMKENDNIVRYMQIASLFISCPAVTDIDNLLVNGAETNIEISQYSVGVLGEVNIDE